MRGIQHPAIRFGKDPGVPPGSTLDRGTLAEKRIDDCPEEGGTLNSGGPELFPVEEISHHRLPAISPKKTRRRGTGSQTCP